MKISVLLNEDESILLKNYMKENKIKSKAEAIRKCLKTAVNMESKYDMLKDMDSKLNRIIYREKFDLFKCYKTVREDISYSWYNNI